MKTTASESHNLNEIVFENRNKNYGAYVIRETYDQRIVQSFFITILFFASVAGISFGLHALFAKTIDSVIIKPVPGDTIVFRPIGTIPLPPPGPKPPANKSAIATAIKDSVPEDKIDTIKVDYHALSDSTGLLANNDDKNKNPGGGSGSNDSVLASNASPKDEWVLTKRPEFPGGDKALMKFLTGNIHYPVRARELGIEGKVYVEFVIDAQGRPVSFQLLRGIGYGCDDEALRVIGMMPKWEPGEFHEQKVSTLLKLPVNFQLIKN